MLMYDYIRSKYLGLFLVPPCKRVGAVCANQNEQSQTVRCGWTFGDVKRLIRENYMQFWFCCKSRDVNSWFGFSATTGL